MSIPSPLPARFRRVALAAGFLAALAGAAAPARAQSGQLLYEWQGRVDHEVQIVPGRRGYQVRGVGGAESAGRFRSRSNAALRGNEALTVQRLAGRGEVDVLGNGVVRIRDSQGGADTYRVRVYAASTGRDRDDRNGRGRNDRDDRRRARGADRP